ncbi:MAG: TetR family transcriptional regulator [Bryobacterales bacterium]|nr:TetR family transcriptional regulator [Bryobacterales bacterium]
MPRAATAVSRPNLQARKQELVREAIWDAAVDLFIAQGYEETTIDQIAEAAGVSRRSFFRYFSSKGDLMAQGVVNYTNSLTLAIDAAPAGAPLLEVMRHTVLAVARYSASLPRTRKIMQVAAQSPAAREAQTARLADLQDRVAEAYARRIRNKRDRLTPRVLAGQTLWMLAVTFRTWFEQDETDIARAAGQVFDTLSELFAAQ